jgi:hypothetical protein
MIGVIDPARKDELVQRAASVLEPGQNAAAGGFKEFKLNEPAGLLLDDDRAGSNPTAADKVADLDLHDVTPTQFAIYSKIEHCAVA